jgi:hypothetical protein
MLLGYDKDGEIKFIFTDEKYLAKQFPKNTAKISNFWNVKDHGLTEMFIPIEAFADWANYHDYKIVNGNITQKENLVKKVIIQEEVKVKINEEIPVDRKVTEEIISTTIKVDNN